MNKRDGLLDGVYAGTLIPMHADFRCDYQTLASHCRDLISKGCQGVVLFGTTGEGSSFSVKERKEALKQLLQLGIDPQKIIIGIICSSVEDAAELASAAADHHCAAMLLAPPFYFKNVTDEGVLAFYRQVIQRISHTDLKVILYHIPQLSCVPLSINTIGTLLQEFPEHVIGLKESEGNFAFTQELLARFAHLKVFVGNETHLTEAVRIGASGAICGVVNVFPELICSLYQYGKDADAPDHNPVVKELLKIVKSYSTIASLKHIMQNRRGADWQILRAPLIPLDQQQGKALMEELQKLHLADERN